MKISALSSQLIVKASIYCTSCLHLSICKRPVRRKLWVKYDG